MKQHTVCFITPPSPWLLDQRVFPSLGILKVAAVAERLGYKVHHLDLNGVLNYEDVVKEYCKTNRPANFALTATTPQMVSATKIKQVLEDWSPESTVIIGGPHPTLVSASFKKDKNSRGRKLLQQLIENWDVVVFGDGEKAIEYVLQEGLMAGGVDADDPKSEFWLSAKELDEQPLAARHLIDLDTYHYNIEGVKVTPLIAQLGCSYGCNFCAGRDSAMLRRVRTKSSYQTAREMEHLYLSYGYKGFMFFDDEINLNHKATMELLHCIQTLQEGYGIEFKNRCFVKANLFNEEQAKAMVAAGFRDILCGFESGSPKILKNINKAATRDDNTRAMEISHKYGLGMKALMSIGHPGESAETIQQTMDWLLEVRPKDFDATIITAYPGSPYFDRAVQVLPNPWKQDIWVFEVNGDRLYMEDIDYTRVEDFYKGGMEDYKSYVWTDYLTSEELVARRNDLEREVRAKLCIPFNQAQEGKRFESSMGGLPGYMYRGSEG